MKQILFLLGFLMLSLGYACNAQQQVDRDYSPEIKKPLFAPEQGPLLLVDGGHFNFHTIEEKFAPFAKVAGLHGFRVRGTQGRLDSTELKDARILVIANALNEKNADSWQQPVLPAFAPEEVRLVSDWVRRGGRLFLIADHMPFAGAAASLAEAFGFSFLDGFALRRPKKNFDLFRFADGTLNHAPVLDQNGPLDSIVSFTGQAFRTPEGATSIITLDSNYKVLMPEVAWEFSDKTKMVPAAGLSQLAYMPFGSGKVVMAGEAAMFTAQRVGDVRIGLSSSFAPHNLQLLTNLLEWLSE